VKRVRPRVRLKHAVPDGARGEGNRRGGSITSRDSRAIGSSIAQTGVLRTFAVLFFLVASAGCKGESANTESRGTTALRDASARTELVIFAAASTRDALLEIESAYELDHNVDVIFNFGSSGNLARQIMASPKADVFLSADEIEMARLDRAGLIVAATRRDLLSNQLVVVEPVGLPSVFTEPFAPAQLAGPRLRRLSLANVGVVPAGRYAKAWLEKGGIWNDVMDRILPGVDVRAALAAVESGGADAGIVYRSDVARSSKARVVYFVPPADGPRITYPVAVIAGRAVELRARAFVDYMSSAAARPVFEEFGFICTPPQSPGR
jgi:molybdate transport system substrate-binding protein